MSLQYLIVFLCFTSTWTAVYSANILGLFPYPGKSHFDFFRPLFFGLANAGHDVTVVSYFPNKEPVINYTDLVLDGMPVIANVVDLKEVEQIEFWMRGLKLANFFYLNYLGLKSCEAAFESNAVKHVLQSGKKYDAVLIEYFASDCMLAISHKLNAPVIGLTSHALMPWHYKRMGSPFIPSFMPNHFLPHSDQMSFLQRLNNFMHHHLLTAFHDLFCHRPTNKLIQKFFGNSIPPVEELVLNTSLMLINQHFSLTGATPYVPGIVEVGGLHIQEPKPLNLEIQKVLDNAKNGAIFVSWGSMVRPETLPSEKLKALVEALSQFPDQIIVMKWSNTTIPNPPKNFYLREWLPQKDILCHPNVRVFMAHGGLLGSTEGCYCGAAIVVTPFFGDQFLNAQAIQARGAGVVLNYRDLQTENIVQAIRTALSPKMQEDARFISESFRNRPQKPLDLAVWWVENIIRTKGAPLAVNASSKMCWFTYHSIDIYIVLFVTVFLSFMGVRILVRRIFFSAAKKAVKQKKQ